LNKIVFQAKVYNCSEEHQELLSSSVILPNEQIEKVSSNSSADEFSLEKPADDSSEIPRHGLSYRPPSEAFPDEVRLSMSTMICESTPSEAFTEEVRLSAFTKVWADDSTPEESSDKQDLENLHAFQNKFMCT
jgi:hypothetical protein